jgi:hypothetical protein
MNAETAIQAFASAGHDLPREAMQWTLGHWEDATPGLLDVLERYTSGADRSDEAASAVFFLLYLAGEKQDTRVFPLLCRLAQNGEAIGPGFPRWIGASPARRTKFGSSIIGLREQIKPNHGGCSG